MPEGSKNLHDDLAWREEELARPEEEPTEADLLEDLDAPHQEEGDDATQEGDESPFTEDDFDAESEEDDGDIPELMAGTDDPPSDHLLLPAIEIVKTREGYTSYISAHLPRTRLMLDSGRPVPATTIEGQLLRLERLQRIAKTFIERFSDWLDHLDDTNRHRRLPACEKKDFYSQWPDKHEENRATGIFSSLFLRLPNQEVIFLDEYLGKTDKYDLSAKAVTEELTRLMLEQPDLTFKELRESLVEQVRTWGPPDYDITEQGVKHKIKKEIITG